MASFGSDAGLDSYHVAMTSTPNLAAHLAAPAAHFA
jgi:hypothetical protein